MNNDQIKTPSETDIFPEKLPDPTTVDETIAKKPVEVGGPKGLEPTRYGDWEKAGRCTDF